MDFQLKALGHWSHLYSLSSVWITMCCSRLGKRDRLTSRGRRRRTEPDSEHPPEPGTYSRGTHRHRTPAPYRGGLRPREVIRDGDRETGCEPVGSGGFPELRAAAERDCKSLCEKEVSSTSTTGGAVTRKYHLVFWHLFHTWKRPYSASKCRCVLWYFLLNTRVQLQGGKGR